ncbi:MAG: DUF805 domain-containing protein [Muribaculum sp.]|nr:DUF805 domain-containing protein [Muribaculum sp.]
MTFTQAVKSFYNNYTNIEGRASRSAYWWVMLYQSVVLIPLAFIAGIGMGMNSTVLTVIACILIGVFSLVNIVPGITLAVRRLHDTNRSGWWYLINLVPYIGAIWFIVLAILPSTPGENNYGYQLEF